MFLHTVHKKVIFCWLPSHMGIAGNERADNFAALGKYNIYNKLHDTKPLIGKQPSAYRFIRRDEVVLSRLKLGHS